ncbi:MAG TPA: YihA family ribosome biogenesis GTP-binding protein [Deltaproteobacteria bacterium]|nr:YihA family ribosome biogenesis GTP-binding protein [Deltaproteobacteria bacterium]
MRNQVGRISFVGSFRSQLPDLGLPEIAFAGRSNVGKSSLLNTLMRRRSLARTSRTPGRTQLINLFQIGDAVVFADLPGYGFARVPERVRLEWGPMVETYLGERGTLRLVVVLVDIRRDAQHDDGSLLWGLTEARIPSVVVATKTDKLSKQKVRRQLTTLRRDLHLPVGQPIPFSARTGAGRGAVWDELEAAIRRPVEPAEPLPPATDPEEA